MSCLIAIVAMSPTRVIGRNGAMPWHLPADLAFFKRTTTGHPVVMGRKTYDSIGRPLPRRRNIVLTRDASWSVSGVQTIHAPADLDQWIVNEPETYIIGGAEIYAAFLPVVDELLITHIREDFEADTWFPAYENSFPRSEVVEETDEFVIRRHFRA